MTNTKSITKDLTETKVSDNGQLKEEQEKSPKQLELESIVAQYNDAIQKRATLDKISERCLGAIEILERQVKEENAEIREDK